MSERGRVGRTTVEGLRSSGCATVHEVLGRRGFLGVEITPIQRDIAVAGTAVTALIHPGDNLALHVALETCVDGDILVVAATAPSPHGVFGELLATSCLARGVRGVVLDAGVRDTRELRQLGFPVWARWVSCEGTVKVTPGSANVPVSIGRVIVNPGDVIVADDDGVVVVPALEAERVLAESRRRIEAESAARLDLAAGEPSLDVFGLRATVESA